MNEHKHASGVAQIASNDHALKRELGVIGAVFMGLGAMVGTGVFVSIGIAAGVAGPAVILAIAIAAIVAACNALSSAQLAASHPIAGGTYEYGYRYLSPALGFTAGWMFLCAKTASAATAALGFAGYLLHAAGWHDRVGIAPIAFMSVALLTVVVLLGLRRANWLNILIVSITLAALLAFIFAGLPLAMRHGREHLSPFFQPADGSARSPLTVLLEATALMFVAFTGYARIATLGEEVREPRRTIPRAIMVTIIVVALLYVAVGLVGVASSGAAALASATSQQAAPLEVLARAFEVRAAHWIVALGAMTAMLGVLLNLILGLSRVLLAIGRRGDGPPALTALNAARTTPYVGVVVAGLAIGGLTLIGSVKTTWSFSAFTVLIYYAITNLAALRLPREARLYPRAIAWIGLLACLGLAFWVEWRIWAIGLGLIAAGLIWHMIARRVWRASSIDGGAEAR
jgi:APA family basic amino acid/polyamine antiporter